MLCDLMNPSTTYGVFSDIKNVTFETVDTDQTTTLLGFWLTHYERVVDAQRL